MSTWRRWAATSTTPPVSDLRDQRTPDGTAYDITGSSEDAETGHAVVLVHGLGLSRQLWTPHIPAFLSRRYRVVSYDLYGHGTSGPPPEEASLGVYADQIARLLDTVGIDQAAIVGFSIGGMINRRFALDHPDRVSALAIVNSPHDRGAEAQEQVEARALTVRDQGAMATMDAALVRWFTPGHLDEMPAHASMVRHWREQVEPESYAQAAWVLANGVRELIAPEPPITVPTLVMTGENDSGSTPAMSHAIAAEIAGAGTVIVDRLQHLGLMEQPLLFTGPILDFLDRNLT